MKPAPQRGLPSVDRLLQSLPPTSIPRPWLVRLTRQLLARHRASERAPHWEELSREALAALRNLEASRLQPVINATGILAHTNLGRAPLSRAALESLVANAQGYCNLEIDLESGRRGRRAEYIEQSLALLCEGDAATVVNNGAAALLIILRHLTQGPRKEVLISRGELIQIGGGFRIPDILSASGAVLREVGTTNQTHAGDYRRAIGPETALLLHVHRSNFYMEGFVDSPEHPSLAAIAREAGLPFVADLGSGALVPPADLPPVAHEPGPAAVLKAGADLVCFSGDKLLGGPQAGLIVGRAALISGIKHDPFFRALRCDKLVLTALQATLDAYLHAAARRGAPPPADVPMIRLLQQDPATLRPRAVRLVESLRGLPVDASVFEDHAEVGGGVCPRSRLSSMVVRLNPHAQSAEELARRLRRGTPPVIAVITRDTCQVNLASVFPEQDEALKSALCAALADVTASPLPPNAPRADGE